jgi:hypothetical protein
MPADARALRRLRRVDERLHALPVERLGFAEVDDVEAVLPAAFGASHCE